MSERTTEAVLDALPTESVLKVGSDLGLRGVLEAGTPMAHFLLQDRDGRVLRGLWFSEPMSCCDVHAYYVCRATCSLVLPEEPCRDVKVQVVIHSLYYEEYDD
jgi:hypothetical protein